MAITNTPKPNKRKSKSMEILESKTNLPDTRGDKGEPGNNGVGINRIETVDNGDGSFTLVFNKSDESAEQITVQTVKGKNGENGKDGKDGFSIKGERGPRGFRGEAVNGKDGSRWFNGLSSPAESLGSIGDYYLDNETGDYYEKIGRRLWKLLGSLRGQRGADGTQGAAGAQGAQGPQGFTGATGPGVAAGGTTGQVLAKNSNTDYDTEWVTGGGGGTVDTIVAGNNIDVDATDPANPIVAVETLTLADISDVTASVTEVNYTDGVTSAIQTQLNTKTTKAFAVAMAVAL